MRIGTGRELLRGEELNPPLVNQPHGHGRTPKLSSSCLHCDGVRVSSAPLPWPCRHQEGAGLGAEGAEAGTVPSCLLAGADARDVPRFLLANTACSGYKGKKKTKHNLQEYLQAD